MKWLGVFLVLLVGALADVAARNEDHPYTFYTQDVIDTIQFAVDTGSPAYIIEIFDALYAHADAHKGDSLVTSRPPGWEGFKVGLTESEKMIAQAIVCAVTEINDPWCNTARDHVVNFTTGSWGVFTTKFELPVAYQISVMWAFDLTVDSGVYSAEQRNIVWDWIEGWAARASTECDIQDGGAYRGASWQDCGLASLAAIMAGNPSWLASAKAGWQDRVDDLAYWGPGFVGAAFNYGYRCDEPLGYHLQSWTNAWIPALAATNLGLTGWDDYVGTSNVSVEVSFDWLTSGIDTCDSAGLGCEGVCGSPPPGPYWQPYLHGNGQPGLARNNTDAQTIGVGSYAGDLTEAVVTDFRSVLEVGIFMYGAKPQYLSILTDESGGKNARGELFEYHYSYWLPGLLNAPSSPEAGLLAHWKLDESGGTVAADSAGVFDGTLVNAPVWRPGQGRVGGALEFDGAFDYVDLDTFEVSGNALTIAGWMRADTFDVPDARILSKASGSSEDAHYFMVGTIDASAPKLRFRLRTGAGGTATLIGGAGTLRTDVWIHFAAVYDGDDMRLYQDGVLVGSLPKTGTLATDSAVPTWLGRNPGGYGPFDGLIDDVRVYDRALSLMEIEELAHPSGLNQPPVASFTASPTAGFEPLAVSFDASASIDPDGDGLSYSWEFGDGGTANGVVATHTYTADGSFTVTLTVDDGQASDMAQTTVTVSTPVVAGLLAHWKLDESGGTVAADSAGVFDGTLVNAPVWRPGQGRVGGALEFDGAFDYVDLDTFEVSGNALTIAGWMRADTFDVPDARILSKASGSSEDAHYFMVGTIDASAPKLRFRLRTGAGGTATLIGGAGTLRTDVWIHFAAVYDGDDMRLYQDGVLVGSLPKTGTLATDSAVPTWLGRNPGGYGPFDGLIDDVRVYDRALSLMEIEELAHPSGLNQPPVASFTASPTAGFEPLAVSFDASASIDPDGDGLSYSWEFGDGGTANGVVATHTYTADGSFTVTLTVDDGQASDMAQTTVTVSTPVVEGLLAHWKLDESGGMVAADSAGVFDGTLVNAPVWRPGQGRVGGALEFDGAFDYVDLDTFEVSGNALTIAGWMRADTFDVPDARILSKASGSSEDAHYFMVGTIDASAPKLRFRLRTGAGGTATLIGGAGTLRTDVWIHFAAVYDGDDMRLYQDGVLVGSLPKTGTLATDSAVPTWLGRNPGGYGPFDGLIDDVRVYDRALSLMEIEELAHPSGLNQPPVASFTASPTAGFEPLAVSFDASASIDPDGDGLSYSWEFGDGGTANGVVATHTYTADGSFTVTLTVDDGQASDMAQTTVTVSTPVVAGLLAHWKLDESGGTVAADSAGVFDGTLVNAPVWRPGQGRVGGALEFDGAFDYVDLDTFEVSGNALTIAGWMRADTFDVPDARILSKASGSSEDAHYFMVGTIDASAPKLRFRLRTGAGGTATLIGGAGTLRTDVWIHFAAVYDGDDMRLYQDGVLVGSLPKTGTLATDSAVPTWLGRNPGGYGPFDGLIDDVRVYDRALSLMEIEELAHPSGLNQPPVASFTASPTAGFEPLAVSFDASASIDPDGDGLSYSWEFGDGGTANGVVATHTYTADGSFTVTLTVDDGQASDMAQTTVTVSTPVVAGLLAHWKLDESGGTVAADSAGVFDGTLVNAPVWRPGQGRVGGALEFDGAFDYVDLDTFEVSGNALTIAGWMRADTFDVPDARILSKASGSSEDAHYFMVGTIDASAPKLRFRLRTGAGGTATLIGGAGTLRTDVWIHFAAVYDGDDMRLYQDGVLVGSLPKTGTLATDSAVPTWLGRNPGGYGPFDGLIDDVRVYDRALSLMEIEGLADPSSLNHPPVAGFTAGPTAGRGPLTVSFDASASMDPDGDGLNYSWAFGDGGTANGVVATHTYTADGSFTVTLTVDDGQASDTAQTTIAVRSDLFPIEREAEQNVPLRYKDVSSLCIRHLPPVGERGAQMMALAQVVGAILAWPLAAQRVDAA